MKTILVSLLISMSLFANISNETISALIDDVEFLKIKILQLNKKIETNKKESLLFNNKEIQASKSNQIVISKKVKKLKTNSKTYFDVIVFSWWLNIREYPSNHSMITDSLTIGTIIEVDGSFVDSEWYKLRNGNYISKNFVRVVSDDITILKIAKCEKTNLRTHPSLDEEYIFKTLVKDEQFNIYPFLFNTKWSITEDGYFIFRNCVGNVK